MYAAGQAVRTQAAHLRGGCEVDVVDAHPGAAHHLEAALGGLKHLAGDLRGMGGGEAGQGGGESGAGRSEWGLDGKRWGEEGKRLGGQMREVWAATWEGELLC